MPLRISFNLDDADLRHFEEKAQQTQANARLQPAEATITAAREVLDSAAQAQVADFVRERFARLRTMIEMATDVDWTLTAEDRQRLLNALACFGDAGASPADAKAGFLDHAIMVELVSRDLEHDLIAYRDFCALRESQLRRHRPGATPEAHRAEWLHQNRESLQKRMHDRRKRSLDRAGSSVRRMFSLFGL